MRVVRNLFALLRGAFLGIFGGKRLKVGKMSRIFNRAEIRIAPKAGFFAGNRLRIDSGAIVSAVSKGQITMGDNVAIGKDNMIVCHDKITIGDGTIFAPNVMIYDHDHVFDAVNGVKHREYKTTPVVIGKNCWIGANVIILRGSIIGDNCVIGAGSIVKCNLESGSVLVQKRENVIKAAGGETL